MIVTPRPLRDRLAMPSRQRGFFTLPGGMGANKPSGGGGDPHWANVVLLLHFDGTNGSTTITDNSSSGKTPDLVAGNTQISTAQSKFGGSSVIFDGAGDYVRYASHADFGFGAGDYTVEGFIYQADANIDRCLFETRTAVNVGIGIYSGVNAANQQNRLIVSSNSATLAGASTTAITPFTWTHWAVTRSSGTLFGFLNGVQVWTVADARTYASASTCFIGSNYVPGQYQNGYVDELRVTKGVARYTSGFTPPSAPFPDS